VFTRSGATWTPQRVLFGSGATGAARQGSSVALSADGNTAIVGGPEDNNEAGAAWVFTRSGATWSQQAVLFISDEASPEMARVGSSVALSADGNTAIAGGPEENETGAAFVFTRSGATWTAQTLLSDFGIGSQQGFSVALSADGRVVIEGGPFDANNAGAAYVFTRGDLQWNWPGSKLVGTGGTVGAEPEQGWSVALSPDGLIALVGAPGEPPNGAVWGYVKAGPNNMLVATATHDINADAWSDILWRHSGGTLAIWYMSHSQVIGSGSLGVIPANWQIVGQRDFNNDGFYDLLWRDSNSGALSIWLMFGSTVQQSGGVSIVPLNWSVAGTSDFNYDGKGDILWRDASSGAVAIWLMDGVSVQQTGSLGFVPSNWSIAATDRRGNIFWRDSNSGALAIWHIYGFQVLQSIGLGAVPLNWTIAGVGDFDGNGSTDILWRDGNTGVVSIWLMDGFAVKQAGSLGVVPSNWTIAMTGDFDGNGGTDILWRDNTGGAVSIWFINGVQVLSAAPVSTVPLDWNIQRLNAD
jgi:hypothetical protein